MQYRVLREFSGVLCALVVVHTCASAAVRRLAPRLGVTPRRARAWFLLLTGLVFVGALHGVNLLKILLIAAGNEGLVLLCARLPRAYATALVWVCHTALLIAVFYLDGLPLGRLAPSLAWLDSYSGLMPRWYIHYNFSMLRLVSYALDRLWAADAYQGAPHAASAKMRVQTPHALHEYTYLSQVMYLLYPPLFLAGPIMTFNDFHSQRLEPLVIPWRAVLAYMARCALAILSIEFVLHYMYVNAIKTAHAWEGFSPMELALLGFWSLEFMWLKLVVPWRTFRLWALLDGVDAPENMIRSITNSPSAMLFWRAWHRSYNLWVVRYLYVPLGGARHQLLASLVVFTFVALWHDLSFTLLAWAWLIVLFLVPEAVGRLLVPARVYGQRVWFRHVRALGTVANLFMMMTANLVGFVVGLDGVQYLWSQLIGTRAGVVCLVQLTCVLYMGAQLMYEYREEERRRGVLRNC